MMIIKYKVGYRGGRLFRFVDANSIVHRGRRLYHSSQDWFQRETETGV